MMKHKKNKANIKWHKDEKLPKCDEMTHKKAGKKNLESNKSCHSWDQSKKIEAFQHSC